MIIRLLRISEGGERKREKEFLIKVKTNWCSSIWTGYCVSNLMVGVKPTNLKLKQRLVNILVAIADTKQKEISERKAVELLEKHDYEIQKVLKFLNLDVWSNCSKSWIPFCLSNVNFLVLIAFYWSPADQHYHTMWSQICKLQKVQNKILN